MKKLIMVIVIALISGPAWAKHIHKEAHYQAIWCEQQGGETEVRMVDGTRCDCLTEAMATEVDFAKKFYEAVGQALHYSMLTARPGGILLIVEQPDEWKYVVRCERLIEFYNLPITLFVIEPETEQCKD